MRFEVFMVVKIQVEVFWVVMSCSVVVGCLHLQDQVTDDRGHSIGLECKRTANAASRKEMEVVWWPVLLV
jgi:hypothetical protein